jgi:hypothetical protein
MRTVKDDVGSFKWEVVAPYIQALNEGLEKSFGDIELTPARFQLTKSEHDDFFTIVLAYKLVSNLKEKNEINRHRYFVSKMCYENNLGFICLNSYQTHLNIGTWDEKHINEEPFVSYDKRRTLNFFKEELPKLMEKYKNSLKEESKSSETKKENESHSTEVYNDTASPSPSASPSIVKTPSPSPKKRVVRKKSKKIEKNENPGTITVNENPASKKEESVVVNGNENADSASGSHAPNNGNLGPASSSPDSKKGNSDRESPDEKEEKIDSPVVNKSPEPESPEPKSPEPKSPEPKSPEGADAFGESEAVIEGGD